MNMLIAKAQVWLSALFLTGYFVVIILFMMGHAKIPPDFKEAFAGLLSLMTAGGLTILYFWFQRQRAGGVPDPTTVTTTTSGEPPSTVTTTAPAESAGVG
jgi:uncharacterized membrane protein